MAGFHLAAGRVLPPVTPTHRRKVVVTERDAKGRVAVLSNPPLSVAIKECKFTEVKSSQRISGL